MKCVIVEFVEKFEVEFIGTIFTVYKCFIFYLENKLYPENQEQTACVEYATVFRPPEALQIPQNSIKPPQSMTGSTSSLNSSTVDNQRLMTDMPTSVIDLDSKSSSATITPIAKSFPK